MPVQFYLFTRPDKQGDHPINVSISLFGERLCTSVGYAIAPDKWDDKTQRVKKNAKKKKVSTTVPFVSGRKPDIEETSKQKKI